ncbi:MAG: thermonuclease family protein [Acetobacteraceae bacterium]
MILLAALFMLSGSVSAVSDADTIRLQGERLRLHGVDAPELSQRCVRANGHSYLAGPAYRDGLIGLIRKRQVTCTWSTRDRYGRPVATCTAAGDTLTLNEQLVLHGYAFAFDYGRDTSPYHRAEELAHAGGRGVWNGHCERPADYRRRHRK